MAVATADKLEAAYKRGQRIEHSIEMMICLAVIAAVAFASHKVQDFESLCLLTAAGVVAVFLMLFSAAQLAFVD